MSEIAGWQRVYVADHPFAAAAVAGALRAAGIEAQVSGSELWSVAVEIFFSEGAAPAVWVPDPAAARAAALVAQYQQATTDDAPDHEWRCTQCQAKVPSTFAACWRCGAAAPLGDGA